MKLPGSGNTRICAAGNVSGYFAELDDLGEMDDHRYLATSLVAFVQNQCMTLNAFAADLRLKLFEEIKAGRSPSQGEFDSALLDEGRKKGAPQLGSTRFEPNSIYFEFIFSDSASAATVFTVRVDSHQRIVFLPVPEWVVESIWQGEIDGSFHFESDARGALAKFAHELEPDSNAKWFERRMAKRRE